MKYLFIILLFSSCLEKVDLPIVPPDEAGLHPAIITESKSISRILSNSDCIYNDSVVSVFEDVEGAYPWDFKQWTLPVWRITWTDSCPPGYSWMPSFDHSDLRIKADCCLPDSVCDILNREIDECLRYYRDSCAYNPVKAKWLTALLIKINLDTL